MLAELQLRIFAASNRRGRMAPGFNFYRPNGQGKQRSWKRLRSFAPAVAAQFPARASVRFGEKSSAFPAARKSIARISLQCLAPEGRARSFEHARSMNTCGWGAWSHLPIRHRLVRGGAETPGAISISSRPRSTRLPSDSSGLRRALRSRNALLNRRTRVPRDRGVRSTAG